MPKPYVPSFPDAHGGVPSGTPATVVMVGSVEVVAADGKLWWDCTESRGVERGARFEVDVLEVVVDCFPPLLEHPATMRASVVRQTTS